MKRITLLLLLAFVPAWAPAQLRSQTPEILNSNAGEDGGSADQRPNIASDSAGHVVAVWTSNYNVGGTIGTDYDILVSRSDDDGATWSAAAPLNSTAATDNTTDDQAVIATDGAGTWIASWVSQYNLGGTIGTDNDLFVARSLDNGATWSTVSVLNTNATTDASSATDNNASLAWCGGTNWVATWQTIDDFGGTVGTDTDIAYATSSDGGQTWSTAALLYAGAATDGTLIDLSPRVAGDATGHAVALWTSANDLGGTIGNDADIVAVTSADAGVTWSAPVAVNSSAATDGGFSDFDGVLTTDGAGTWMASWRSQWPPTGTDNEIMASRSTNNGASWSTMKLVNSTASTDLGATDIEQRIAASGPGVFAIVWASALATDGDSDYDLLASVTNDSGATWSGVTYLNDTAYTDGTSVDDSIQVAGDGSGSFFAVWRSTFNLGGNIGSDDDVFRIKFTPDFTAPEAVTITPVTSGPTSQDSIAFTVDFNQDVTGFSAEADLVITHAGTSHAGVLFAGGPATYTVTLENVAGDGTITLAAATGSGTVNNLGVGVGASVTSDPVLIDNTPPVPVLSSSAADPVGGAFTVEVDTGGDTTDFALADVVPVNATVSDFAGSGSSYTFTLTPTATPCSVSIPAGAYMDLAGNASVDSNVLSRNYDGTLPSVISIVPSTTGPTNATTVNFAVTFDEPVQGFDSAADLILTHTGTAHGSVSISGSLDSYAVDVSGISGDGAFTLSISTTSDVEDLTGNPLGASVTSAAVLIDNTAPSFTNVVVTPSEAYRGELVLIQFESDEPIDGALDVTVNGNDANGGKAVHSYQYIVQPGDPLGPAALQIAGFDAAGNLGAYSNSAAFNVVAPPVEMPLAAWPALCGLAFAGGIALRRRCKA